MPPPYCAEIHSPAREKYAIIAVSERYILPPSAAEYRSWRYM
ncbi:hypothetical protein HMPREF9555_02025 [Selenomonas artemidis F0399]|uniref:Uncharacterized protein n=1 Tax=Selenomonas artemidis F0399 TaxID=749551 RepID=E7N4T1_9FIRM|nr:hypothetical protein HMPREF9555_02025 [Selenomonas artemidis F0399]